MSSAVTRKLGGAIAVLLCGAALVAIAAFFCLHPEGNSDLFWQLKTGELIVRDRALLEFDPFSFTALGNAWFNHEWLAEVIFFLVASARGFAGLSFLSFGIGLLLAAAIFAGAWRGSGSAAIALALTLAAFIIGVPRIQLLRPDLISFLCFAILLLIVTGALGRRPWLFWLVIPVLILWANIHASVIIGPPTAILFLIERMLSHRRDDDEDAVSPDFVAVMGCAVVLAPLFNPHTYRIYLFPFEHLLQRYSVSVTSDWAGLSWFSPRADLAAWGLVALCAAAVILLVRRRREIPGAMLCLTIACTAAGFWMVRFLPYAVVALCFLLARLLRGGAPISRRVLALAALAPLLLIATSATTGPFLGIGTGGGRPQLIFGRPMGVGLDEEAFPVEAVQFVQQQVHGRIFNDMAWGGYLIWSQWPLHRVFIDTRTPVYGDIFVKEYADALFNERVFNSVVMRYGITHVLYDVREIQTPGGPLQFLLRDPRWQLAFRSDNAVLFVRGEP